MDYLLRVFQLFVCLLFAVCGGTIGGLGIGGRKYDLEYLGTPLHNLPPATGRGFNVISLSSFILCPSGLLGLLRDISMVSGLWFCFPASLGGSSGAYHDTA